MNPVVDPVRRVLGPASVLHLRGPATVAAEGGTVWITQDGEPDDVVLDAGGRHRVDGHAPVLVSALGGTAVVRVLPERQDRPDRAARWLRALTARPVRADGPAAT